MFVTLHLIRHGETNNNADKTLIQGRSIAEELNERGKRQASVLGQRLRKEGVHFDMIFSSTAERSRNTAEIVADALEFPKEKIILSEDLLELCRGDWEKKLRKEVYTSQIILERERNSWHFKAPNGESQREVEIRMHDWFEKNVLKDECVNLNIAVFSHGTAIKCFLRGVLDSSPQMTHKISVDNCSVTKLKYYFEGAARPGWAILSTNDNGHLADVGFTPDLF